MIIDYTILTIGTKIGRGEVKNCPYCNRVGLVEQTNDVLFGIHSEWRTLSPNNAVIIGGEGCPKEGDTLIRVPKEPAESNPHK
jgi:hypothetical protein